MEEQGAKPHVAAMGLSSVASSQTQSLVLPVNRPSSSYLPYPAPLAKYEEVVASRQVFMSTSEKLHFSMGTKFMIPTIGGKELDLHRLFVEVTSRGGIDKVLKEKRWKEVTAVFNFPPTATNASFVLRKYYVSLLQHYEQIYYFKARGWIPLSTDVLSTPNKVSSMVQGPDDLKCPSLDGHLPMIKRRRIGGAGSSHGGASSAPPPVSSVVGVIDGKFESGYLVTVSIGPETLKGVLYQAAPHGAAAAGQPLPFCGALSNINEDAAAGVKRRRRRKKSEIKRRDPAHPKPNRSGYNFFFAEQHAKLKLLHPGKDRQISRMIGALWTKLNEGERAVYQGKAVEDKERYRVEMEGYRERLRMGPVISNAVPIQQRLPEQREKEVDMAAEAYGKAETEEGDSADSPENGSTSDKTDNAEEDLNAEASGDAAAAVPETSKGFELRKRAECDERSGNAAAEQGGREVEVPLWGARQ